MNPILWHKISNATFEANTNSSILGKPYEPFEQVGIEWPAQIKQEGFSIEYDTNTKIETLQKIEIYNPDNPYNSYIRKSMRVVRKQFNASEEEKEAIDYYLENKIEPWHRYDEDEFKDRLKSEDNVAGIYMLYDSKDGYFYVGKAEQVYKRMQEHRDSQELINKFDYYRYSLIDPYYYDDIFMIENAAIHDCAMILNMGINKDYREKSLSGILSEGKNIKDITIVNSVKKQTKRPSKKENKK